MYATPFEDEVGEGDVLFVSANTDINLRSASNSELHIYRAGVNSRFFEASS